MCIFDDDNRGGTTEATHAAPGLLECPIPPAPAGVNRRIVPGLSSVRLMSAVGFHSNQLTFSYYTAPALLGVFPMFGSIEGGTPVIVTGIGFKDYGGVACSFGTVESQGEVLSTSEVACISPAAVLRGASAELADRVVPVLVAINGVHYGRDAGGWSEKLLFEYVEVPVVSFIHPTTGPPTFSGEAGGSIHGMDPTTTAAATRYITVHGAHFVDSVDLACRFGTLLTAATFVSTSEVRCVIPPLSIATGDAPIISLTMNGVDFSREGAPSAMFTYVPSPELLGISPRLGPATGGTPVTVFGRGFGKGARSSDQASLFCRFELEDEAANNTVRADFDRGVWEVRAIIESNGTATCLSPAVGSSTSGGKRYARLSISHDEGWSFAPSILRFLFYPAVRITSVTPMAVPASSGRHIMVSGHGFLPGYGLLLCTFRRANLFVGSISHGKSQDKSSTRSGQRNALSTAAVWLSDELLQCKVPIIDVATTASTLDVHVTNNGMDLSASAAQVIVYPLLELTGLFPTAGPRTGGTLVRFTIKRWTLPSEPGGMGTIHCFWGAFISVSAEISEQQADEDRRTVVTCVSPAADAIIGIDATAAVDQDLYAEWGTKTDAAEEVIVTLQIDGQNATIAGVSYFYHAVPEVISASPSAGVQSGGTEVTIWGSGFGFAAPGQSGFGGAMCAFGEATVSAVVVTDRELRCRSPPWAGRDVTNTGTSVEVKVSLNRGVDFAPSSIPFHYLPTAHTGGEIRDMSCLGSSSYPSYCSSTLVRHLHVMSLFHYVRFHELSQRWNHTVNRLAGKHSRSNGLASSPYSSLTPKTSRLHYSQGSTPRACRQLGGQR